MNPMLGREVVKGQQLLTVFAETFTSSLVLRLVFRQKRLKRLVRLLSGLGHPDLVQVGLGSGLYALGHVVEHIGCLVYPAALLPRLGIHRASRCPEAHGAIPGRYIRS